jgi:hypothetical protein
VGSMVTDPAIRRLAPRVDESTFTYSPYKSAPQPPSTEGGRYVRW